MKNHKIFFLLVFLMISCASQQYFITSKYKSRDIKNASLLVLFTDDPVIENKEDVNLFFGNGVVEDVYINFFVENFPHYLMKHSSLREIKVNPKTNDIPVVEKLAGLTDEDTVKISIPVTSPVQTENGYQADFLLLIQNLTTGRNVTSDKDVSNLVQNGDFTIWDNTAGQIVSFGKFSSSQGVYQDLGPETWKSGMDQIAEQIIKSSPF